jgi:hypothetical protein
MSLRAGVRLFSCSIVTILLITTTAPPLIAAGPAKPNELPSASTIAASTPAAVLPQEGRRKKTGGGGKKRNDNGANENNAGKGGNGLQSVENGSLVFDSTLNVYWLADANLAADLRVRSELKATSLHINPDGSMDYPTAQAWVDLMRKYDGGKGYLGHNNWQLPVTPTKDPGCDSFNKAAFGVGCTESALGNLYSVGLGHKFPDSVAPGFGKTIGPFSNLQPAIYWTADSSAGGETTYSFTTGVQQSNTETFNFFHELPTVQGCIDDKCPGASGVVKYTSGPAANKAVYDTPHKQTWVLDANLPLADNFNVSGTTTIDPKKKKKSAVPAPLIDADGKMMFETANNKQTGWVAAMNRQTYAGSGKWALPTEKQISELHDSLKLQQGDPSLLYGGNAGPFKNLQPFFYWACQRDDNGNSQSPCNYSLNPPDNKKGEAMRWSFNFDEGFQGTDETTKTFFVMVYFPAPSAAPKPAPTPPGKCGTPRQCCAQAGGTWIGGRCQ